VIDVSKLKKKLGAEWVNYHIYETHVHVHGVYGGEYFVCNLSIYQLFAREDADDRVGYVVERIRHD
jgi:hypothetical protein